MFVWYSHHSKRFQFRGSRRLGVFLIADNRFDYLSGFTIAPAGLVTGPCVSTRLSSFQVSPETGVTIQLKDNAT